MDKTFKMQYLMLASLYGCQGLFFAAVVAMPAVLFQNLGAPIAWITFWTGLLALPWTLKVFAAPAVDRAENLRRPIIIGLAICVLACVFISIALACKSHFVLLLGLLALLGSVAACLENFVDRIYLSIWSAEEQTQLMWFRNTAFRVTYLFGAGLLVSSAGYLNEVSGNVTAHIGWSVAFAITALTALFGLLVIARTLPSNTATMPSRIKPPTVVEALVSFFKIKHLWRFLLYLSVFRLGDAVLSCVAQPFLLNPAIDGGLGLKTSQVGFLYGTLGAISLIIGGITGGVAIKNFGVKPLLIPFSLLQTSAIACYCGLAVLRPNIIWIGLTNSFEQFTFGLTTACYSVVMLATVLPRHKATHYGLTCAFVNFGLLVPTMYSGTLVQHLGYANFFALSAILSLLGPLVSCILPPSQYVSGDNSAQVGDRPTESANSALGIDFESTLALSA